MTPSQSKKPLPSSTSMAFPDRPVTPEQWTMTLQRIKALHLRGQSRPCATRCDQLLSETKTMPNPLFATYLHFYSALSTESLARLTHNLSASKIPILLQAKESYQKAASSLPPRDQCADPTVHQPNNAATELSSPASEETHRCSTPSPLSPNSPPCSPSRSSLDPQNTLEASPAGKRPSPLHIHQRPTLHLITSISTPPHTPTTQISPDSVSRPTSIGFSATTSIWLRSRARERFTARLDSFRDMLARHVEVVEGLVRIAEEAQRNRWARKPRLGGLTIIGADEDTGGDDDERERERRGTTIAAVLRGRERGWARPRFQPERYAALCEQALSEL